MGSALIGRARRRAPEPVPATVKATPTGPDDLAADPFPARHLIYHIWPSARTDSWKWNVQQLLDRIDLFTGVRSIAVVTGPGTATLEEVQAAFAGVRIDHWIHRPNDPQRGEGATFPLLLQTLPADGVTFYAHAKGASYSIDQENFTSVRLWARLLYRVNLDVWPAVAQQLATYPITGAFKRHATFPEPVKETRWHYSGTFFWFRNADSARPNCQALAGNRYGVELWPGSQFPQEQMGETFGGDGKSLYGSLEAAKWDLAADDWIRSMTKSRPVASVQTIPISKASEPWRGMCTTKPWHYDVTAIIPVLEPDRSLVLVIELLRLQTERPYILLEDTGSRPETMAWLESLRAADVEVSSVRMNAVCHPSEPVSIALDRGVARSQSRFTFFTHSDCFLRSRSALAELKALAAEHVVAGHQITERPYEGWENEFGHTILMVDQHEIDRLGIRWSMREAMRADGRPDFWPDYDRLPCSPNYPDTETNFNRGLKLANVRGHMTGAEKNYARNVDGLIDHVRSHAASKLYSPEYYAMASQWMPAAIQEAQQRINEWSQT